MRPTLFFFLVCFAVLGSQAAAKTFTMDEALGEFRPNKFYSPLDVSLQELDGLPGYSRAEFEAAYDAAVSVYVTAGLNPTDYLPPSFEEFYEQEIQRAKEGSDIDDWYTDGLTVSVDYYSYFPWFGSEAAFGIVQSFGESVLPRSVTFLFDAPQDLVSIELFVQAEQPDLVPPYFEITGVTGIGQVLPRIAVDTLGQTTLVFDNVYENVSQFSIRSALHPDKPVFTGTGYEFNLRFDQLVVRDVPGVSQVPLPAMVSPFALAVLCLFGLGRQHGLKLRAKTLAQSLEISLAARAT